MVSRICISIQRVQLLPLKTRTMSSEKERILCAAIWFDDKIEYPHQPKNIDQGRVFSGWRHSSIYPQLRVYVLGSEITEGFLSSQNRFLTRIEAGKTALSTGQIKELKYSDEDLYSEDLY